MVFGEGSRQSTRQCPRYIWGPTLYTAVYFIYSVRKTSLYTVVSHIPLIHGSIFIYNVRKTSLYTVVSHIPLIHGKYLHIQCKEDKLIHGSIVIYNVRKTSLYTAVSFI